MTGFGRGEVSAGPFRSTVEIRSVNHRFADVKLKLPADLDGLEQELQRRLRVEIRRGRVDVTVSVARDGDASPQVEINRFLVASYLQAAERLRSEHGLAGEVTVQQILALPDAVRIRSGAASLSEAEAGAVIGALEAAIEAHDRMRRAEGEILSRDLSQRLASIGKLRARIEKNAPSMAPRYAKKLQDRLRDLDAASVDPARVAQEVAMAAEKVDITEELVRLGGYLEQMDTLLSDAAEPVGKKIDFILQEMNREVNTINSKAIDLAICQDAIEMKAEVEKIREQVQNIE